MKTRISLRIQKSFDTYEIKTGSAGFIQIFKNGKRIQPKNAQIIIRKRKDKDE